MDLMNNKKIIFICSYNSVRSPIAEGLFRQKGYGQKYSVCSAGLAPIRVRPYAVRVMQESGIDITGHIPASVYTCRNTHFDYVITLCDNARNTAEEVLSGSDHFFHKNFISPLEIGMHPDELLGEYRQLRDAISSWLDELFPFEIPVAGQEYAERKPGSLVSGPPS